MGGPQSGVLLPWWGAGWVAEIRTLCVLLGLEWSVLTPRPALSPGLRLLGWQGLKLLTVRNLGQAVEVFASLKRNSPEGQLEARPATWAGRPLPRQGTTFGRASQ